MSEVTVRAPVSFDDARFVAATDRDAWNAALRGIDHAYAHTFEHARAIGHSMPVPPMLFSARVDGTDIACTFTERGGIARDLCTPYGFGGFVANGPVARFPERWRAFTAAAGYVSAYVGLNPLLGERFVDDDCGIATHDLYVLDLRPGLAAVRERFAKSIRAKIRHWPGDGTLLETDRDALAAALPDLYAGTVRRVGAGAPYAFAPETLRAWVHGEQTVTLGVRRPSGPIEAIAVFGYTDACADYLISATSDAGRDYSAGLIWEAIRILVARGVPWLNLGGGVVNGDGLAAFKRRFGAERRRLHALALVCDRARYDGLCANAGIRRSATAYFPPYRAPGAERRARP